MALSFEEAQRPRAIRGMLAFNKRYGMDYPVVLAGDQADLAEKVPQIHNLNSFPTTIFLGRDGLVRGVPASPARRAGCSTTTRGRDHRDGGAPAGRAADDQRPAVRL